MEDKNYKLLWITIQTFLFFVPIIVCVIMTPYNISYDTGYVKTVNPRVLDGGSGDLNIEGAVEDIKDTEGAYYYKEWKLQHQELYYVYNIITGLLFGAMLQMFNLFWMMHYCERRTEW